MAYAVKTGMVVGTSETNPTLGYANPLDGVSYAAMILRHLGYSVTRQNFIQSIEILHQKGAFEKKEVSYFNKPQLIKDDAIGMAYGTLNALSNEGDTLIDKLIYAGIVSREVATSLGVLEAKKIIPVDFAERTNSRPSGYNEVYFQILAALRNQTDSIVIIKNEYSDSFEKIKEIVDLCIRENPEILYYNGFGYKSDGNISFRYRKDLATFKQHKLQLEQKIKQIIDQIIDPNMTDYQKEQAIHDYLVKNCEYDYKGFETGQIPHESYTVYGALCLGVAVCEGYAEATALLLNSVGVETSVIVGESRNIPHAWNIVKIDGEYYHLDVTWNDPVMANKDSNQVHYDYFNLNDHAIAKDHTWKKEDYPTCTATRYQYYVYNNMTVKSTEQFIERVIEEVQRGNKNIVLQMDFKDDDTFDLKAAVDKLVNTLYLNCSYTYNDIQKVVGLNFK